MVEESIKELIPEVFYDPPESNVKRRMLIECVLARNSNLYLGKVHTEEQVNKLSAEEVDKLFRNYKAFTSMNYLLERGTKNGNNRSDKRTSDN